MTTTSGAVNHSKKVFNFVEDLSKKSGTLYDTTRRQLIEMLQVNRDTVAMLENILATTLPRGQTRESLSRMYSTSSVPDSKGICQSLQSTNMYSEEESLPVRNERRICALEKKVDKILEILTNNPNIGHPNDENSNTKNNDSTAYTNIPKSDNNNDSYVKNSEIENKRKDNKRKLEKMYDVILKLVVNSNKLDIDSSEITKIADAIKLWFEVRILNLNPMRSKFRYHLTSIPGYIKAIIGCYADAEDRSAWLTDFYNWIDRIRCNDPSVSSYALPYEVFEHYKQLDSDRCTMHNYSLWNILYKCGLNHLEAMLPSGAWPILDIPDENGNRVDIESRCWGIHLDSVAFC